MKLFIESLRLQDGALPHLELHQKRMALTLLAHFGFSVKIDLVRELERRSLPASGLYKIRVTYAQKIESLDIDPYTRHSVERLQLVDATGLDYRFKYADRKALDALRAGLPPGTQPLLVQNGLLTDALYANLCFYDGVHWVTPARPLLSGTARAAALLSGQVISGEVSAEDIRTGRYAKVKLINCMAHFSEAQEITLDRLVETHKS